MVWWLYTPQWNPFLAGLSSDDAPKGRSVDAAFSALSKHNPQSACMWSAADGFHQFSDNWHHISGQLPQDCMGENWCDYWDDKTRICFDEALASLFHGQAEQREESHVVEGRVMHGEGQWRVLQFLLLPTGHHGKQKLSIMIADVTEQATLRNQAEETQRQNALLEHSRASFLSNMSHELRTPLNAILGFAQMLEHGALNDEGTTKEYLQNIQDSGQDLLGKISDLIELANIDSGNSRIDEMPINVREMIRGCIEMNSHRAFSQNISLHLEPGRPHLMIRGDRAKLMHCISHLIGEAIEHSPSGGVISVSYHADTEHGMMISVHDRGQGLTANTLNNIQNALQSSQCYYQTDIHNISIPLAVCKEIADLHEGHLELQSLGGKGCITTLTLPAARIISMSAQIKPKRSVSG